MPDTVPASTAETFAVDSALLSEIGEKLVTQPHVALAELVKNAYDSDATAVHLVIRPSETGGGPRIEIRDNGHGMTLEQIRAFWMRIGTPNKTTESVSPHFGRPRTGAKGIGRFACRRLGTVLTLTSTARSSNDRFEETVLEFTWASFTPGTDVATVTVMATTRELRQAQTGLTLVMSGAAVNEWTQAGYAYLKRQLAALCANQGCQRPGFAEDPGFAIYLDAPEVSSTEPIQDLRLRVQEAGWGTLEAEVRSDGHAVCTLRAMAMKPRTHTSTKRFPNLIGTRLKLGIYVIDHRQIRDKSILSQHALQDITRDHGGVQCRFRGFRIYPYGDANDDWLDIERDRARRLGKPDDQEIFDYAKMLDGIEAGRSMLNLLSMRNFLGSVVIADQCTALQPKADRMGFLDSDAFRELKAFTRYAIDWSMVVRDWWTQNRQDVQREQILEQIAKDHGKQFALRDSPKDAIRAMRSTLANLGEDLPQRHLKAINFLQQTTDYLDKSIAFTTRDLARLRLVASTSTLTLLFAHEMKSMTGIFSAVGAELRRLVATLPKAHTATIERFLADLVASQRSLNDLQELTHAMGVIGPHTSPVHLDLRSVCQRAIARFQRVRDRYQIDIRADGIPDGILVGPMLEGELLAIVLNVISNSIKSVIAHGSDHIIELTAEKGKKHTVLHIKDMGIGISPESAVDIFTPLVADPDGRLYDSLHERLNHEDAILLGHGSGLGLSIVRGILRSRNGDAQVVTPEPGWNFHMQLILP